MGKRIKTLITNHWLALSFLVFYFSLIAYKIIHFVTPFYDWDESIYAQVGREMIQNRSFIPLWQGQFWLDKPPLTPLAYGIVETLVPLPAEVSTRLFTLLLTVTTMFLIYLLYRRYTKDTVIAAVSLIITGFVPLFLQRTQVLNVDIFLLLGWVGYVFFFPRFYLSLFFLAAGVLSKSLLGFYTPLLFMAYLTLELITKKLTQKEYRRLITLILIQILIMALWYLVMTGIFKGDFIRDHFLDSHLKRVTASIESHFGTRTFYIELLINQFGSFSWLIAIGLVTSLILFIKKRNVQFAFYTLFFVPWFLFLNLTKTKIAWYLYPIFPQFALLSALGLALIKKYRILYFGAALTIVAAVLYQNLIVHSLFLDRYSSYDDYYYTAIFARNRCSDITVLVDPGSRTTHDTLKKMNLLISTSEWWGNHPSLVYYSGKKVRFVYDPSDFLSSVSKPNGSTCFLMESEDLNNELPTSNLHLLLKQGPLYLYR